MQQLPKEILLQILNEPISLKNLFLLNMSCKFINEVISESARYQFIKQMCKGSSTISLSYALNDQEKPIVSFKVNRSFINYSDIYSIDQEGTFTFNIIKVSKNQEDGFKAFLNKMNDIESESLQDGIEEGTTIKFKVLFNVGLCLVTELPTDDSSFEVDSGKITFYDNIKPCFEETEYNKEYGKRAKVWLDEWIEQFISSRTVRKFWKGQDFVFKYLLDRRYLKERHCSDEHYKCHRCKRFSKK